MLYVIFEDQDKQGERDKAFFYFLRSGFDFIDIVLLVFWSFAVYIGIPSVAYRFFSFSKNDICFACMFFCYPCVRPSVVCFVRRLLIESVKNDNNKSNFRHKKWKKTKYSLEDNPRITHVSRLLHFIKILDRTAKLHRKKWFFTKNHCHFR